MEGRDFFVALTTRMVAAMGRRELLEPLTAGRRTVPPVPPMVASGSREPLHFLHTLAFFTSTATT